MKVKYIYLMEMVITQFEQMMDYLTLTRAGPFGITTSDMHVTNKASFATRRD